MREQDGEKGKGMEENSGNGNNERENLMGEMKNNRKKGNNNAVQPAVCAPSAALVNTPGCGERAPFHISLLLLL